MDHSTILGRLPSPLDRRDYPLRAFMPSSLVRVLTDIIITSKIWKRGPSLDQGNTPHCVGFSMADFGNCEPVIDSYGNADGHAFYTECKKVDGMPNEDGSTIRAAGDVLRNKKLIDGYAFAANESEVRWWILNRGPVIMGTIWTSDMFYPDTDGFVWADGITKGGHAWLAYGYDGVKYFCQNQWANWGYNRTNTFFLEPSEMQILMNRQGEALAAVELEHFTPKPSPTPSTKGTKSSTVARHNLH